MKSNDSLKKLLEERRIWYKTINKVSCPCLNKDIIFNSKGFYHLRYDGHKKERPLKEQMYKLGLLPLVIPVIKSAKEIYKYEKTYSKLFRKHVEFWALKEIVGKQNIEVRVILRKVGNGNITFYSVMKKSDNNQKNRR